jgi:hypothetical protein
MAEFDYDRYSSLGTEDEEPQVVPEEQPETTGPDFSRYESLGAQPELPADTDTPPEVAAPVEEDDYDLGDLASDAGAMWGRGSGGLATGVGQLFDWVGMDDAGEALKRIGQRATEYYSKGLSEEAKAELDKEFMTLKEGGKWYNPLDWERPEDAAGIFAAFLIGMESLPATVVGMGAGGAVGKGLYTVASKTKKLKALQKVAEVGRKRKALGADITDDFVKAGAKAEKIMKRVGTASGAIGGGAGEAVVAAGMAGADVEERLMNMTHDELWEKSPGHYQQFFDETAGLGMSFDERVNHAKESLADLAGSQAGLEAGIATFLFSSPAQAMWAPAFNKAVPWAAGPGKLKGALIGGAGETVQEMAQSGAEALVSNIAIKEYADETLDIAEGVVNQIVAGGVAGFGMGGTFGGMAAPTKAGAATAEAKAAENERNYENGIKLRAHAVTAVAGLMDSHGLDQAAAIEMVAPTLERFSKDQNILSAVSDLRHLEQYGRPREIGVDDQANTLENVQLIPDGSNNGVDYFMIEKTVGADGGRVDAMRAQDAQGTGIHVIEQFKADGTFDEHKVVLGAKDEAEAVATYQRYYRGFEDEADRNPRNAHAMNETEFEGWLQDTSNQYAENLPTREVLEEQEQEVINADQRMEEAAEEVREKAAELAVGTTPTEEVKLRGGKDDEEKLQKPPASEAPATTTSDQKPPPAAGAVPVAKEQPAEKTEVISTDTNIQRAKDQRPKYSLAQRMDEYEKETGSNMANFLSRRKEPITEEDAGQWATTAIDYVNEWYKNPIPQGAWGLNKQGFPKETRDMPKEAAPAYAGLIVTRKALSDDVINDWAEQREFKKGSALEIGQRLATAAGNNDLQAIADVIQSLEKNKRARLSEFNAPFLRALAIKTGAPAEVFRSKPEAISHLMGFRSGDQRPLFSLSPMGRAAKVLPISATKNAKVGSEQWANNYAKLSKQGGYLTDTLTSESRKTAETKRVLAAVQASDGGSTETARQAYSAITNSDHRKIHVDALWAIAINVGLNVKTPRQKTGKGRNHPLKSDLRAALDQWAKTGETTSVEEVKRREKASERMREYNQDKKEKREHTKKLGPQRSWADWKSVWEGVDAETAGATTPEERQEAIIDWIVYRTASKFFKRWFGKSKIVDPLTKEPLVMYAAGVGELMQASAPGEALVLFERPIDMDTRMQKGGRPTTLEGLADKQIANYPVYAKVEKVFDYNNPSIRRSLKRFLRTKGVDYKATMALLKRGDVRAIESLPVLSFLHQRGYDGYWIDSAGERVLYVFDPRNVKSATGNVGTFSPYSGHIAYALKSPDADDIFYSKYERWVMEKMPKSVKKDAFISGLSTGGLEKKGIKKEEVADLGIKEWAEEQGDTITKEDLLRHVREHRVDLVEVETRPETLAITGEDFGVSNAEAQIEYVYQYADENLADYGVSLQERQNILEDYRTGGIEALDQYLPPKVVSEINRNMDQAKLDLWQAEYYSNRTRNDRVRRADEREHDFRGNEIEAMRYEDLTVTRGRTPTYREMLLKVPDGRKGYRYMHRHWADDNVLIHMRMHIQYDSSTGTSTLIVEEIQSDLHQHGYRYGYAPAGLSQAQYDELNLETGKVPESIMQDSWKMVGMKRMMRYAVENGCDRVAWVTGDMQAERYDRMLRGVPKVELEVNTDGPHPRFRVHLWQGTYSTVPSWWVPRWKVGSDFLTDEVADRILAKYDAGEKPVLEGDELKFYGGGLKRFYDKNLKTLVKKYIKQWGVEPQLTTLPIVNQHGQQTTADLWAFDITDKMSADVMNGQPMYSLNSLTPTIGSEITRRLELYQLRNHIEQNTDAKTKARALKARIMDGLERGYYSEAILRHTGIMRHNTRDKMLFAIANRLHGQEVTERTSLSRRVIQQELARIIDKLENPPVYHVWNDWTELPPEIRHHVVKDGAQDRVEGLLYPPTGEVHFVANNISSIERLHRIFVEEVMGHHGLRNFFGEELNAFLYEILPQVEGSDEWNKLLIEYPQLEREMGYAADPERVLLAKLAAAEELIAKQDVKQSVWERFVAWVRAWLRRAGMITNYTNNDLRNVMRQVHAKVINGTTPHPWNKRNHVPVFRAGPMHYSLYGGAAALLTSKLEAALKKMQPKMKPKGFITQLKGQDPKEWTAWGSKANLKQAQSLQFNERELQLTGVLDWLLEQHHKAPNVQVTREQVLDVFLKTRPKIQVLSRGGYYLFPALPIGDLLTVHAVRSREAFDEAAAKKEWGFLTENVNEILDESDQKALKALGGGRFGGVAGLDAGEKITPALLDRLGIVEFGFDTGVIPSLAELKDEGWDSKQIAALVGLKDMNAPISSENSNALIRGWVAGRKILELRRAGKYIATTFNVQVISAAKEISVNDNAFSVSAPTTDKGEIDFVVVEPDASEFKKRVANRVNAEIDRRRAQLRAEDLFRSNLNEKLTNEMLMQDPTLVLHNRPMLEDLPELLERTIKAEVQDTLAGITYEDAQKVLSSEEEPLPEFPGLSQQLLNAMQNAVTFTEKTAEVTTPGRTFHPSHVSLYPSLTMEGGKRFDVLSIQMYGKNQNRLRQDVIGPRTIVNQHYGTQDVVHLRVKTRFDSKGKKIFFIEEMQSDWGSNLQKALPVIADRDAWVDKHQEAIIKAANLAHMTWGWKSTDHDLSGSNVVGDFVPPDIEAFMSTPLSSKTMMGALREIDAEVAAGLAAAVNEFNELTPDVEDMPWAKTYFDLGLRAAVAYARQNDYHAVAWPEGSEVARIYSDYIGQRADSLSFDFQYMMMRGAELTNDGETADRALDTDYQERVAEGRLHGPHGVPYSADYLFDMVKEGGPNAEVAKDGIKALEAWFNLSERDRRHLMQGTALQPTSDQSLEAWKKVIFEINNPRVQWNQQRGRLILMFPEKFMFNAKLHKLLYNHLMPQAARDIAKDSKAMIKRGEASTGMIFLEDVYNAKRRGTRQVPADQAAPERTPNTDFYDLNTTDLSTLLNRIARNIQIFSPAGATLRDHWTGFHYGRSTKIGDFLNERVNPEVGEAFRQGVQTPVPIELLFVEVLYASDWDNQNPWVHQVHANVEQDTETTTDPAEQVAGVIQIPARSWERDYESVLLSNGPEFQAFDFYTLPALYRFAYQVMQAVWGIENPNPFVFDKDMIEDIFWKPYFDAMQAYQQRTEAAQGNVGPNANRHHVDRFDDLLKEMQDEYVNDGMYENWAEPSSFYPPNRPFGYMVDVVGFGQEMPTSTQNISEILQVNLKPPAELIEDHMDELSLSNQFEAAAMYTFLSQQDNNQEMERLAELIPELSPATEEERRYIPGNLDLGEQPAVEQQEEKEKEPEFNLENPEFEEQVCHAIFINERVAEKDIPVLFSLRPEDDRARSIVNNKIARSHGEMTVLDRVSHWLSVMMDKIKTGDMLWNLKQGMLDDAASIERWERDMFGYIQDASISAYKMMHMTKNLPSVMAAVAKVGIPVYRDGVFRPAEGRKGFVEIFRPIYEHREGDLMSLFEGYAAARRSVELIGQTNRDGTSREKLFTPEEIQELLETGERYPEFKTAFDDWTNFNNDLLTLAVERGVLSAEDREAWAANAYVPFYRAMEEIEGIDQRTGYGRIKAGVEGQRPNKLRLWGSDKKLGNITENMWFNTASLLDKIYKNTAMTRVVDMLDGVAMHQEDMPWEAVRVTNSQIASALTKAGVLDENAEAQVRAMSSEQRMMWNRIFRKVRPTGDDIVSVMREGRPVYYKVSDPQLLITLQGMGAEGLAGLMKAMGMSKALLTRMITIDPAFMLANWTRDTLSAWVTSDANFVPVADSIKSMGDVFKEDGTFIQMMMSGAGGGGFYDLTGGNVRQALKDELGRGPSAWLSKAWKGYMKLGAASENSNRLAIANRIMKNGGSYAEAMYQAQDILNFTMSGSNDSIRFLIRTVPFLNARMQGIYRLYRGAKDHPVGFMLKGAALMSATLALLARNWGDDDYERLEDYQKDMYWNFFVDGMHYAIPKPFEVGLLFATLPERAVRNLLGRDDIEATTSAVLRGLGETLAFNPTPQLFKPVVEQVANKNFFTGSPIVNQAMSGVEYPHQAYAWTSPAAGEVARMVPEALGPAGSPLRVEHVVRAYTGTMGLYTLGAIDWVVRGIRGDDLPELPTRRWWERPVLSRFIKGPTELSRQNRYATKLYDLFEESNKAQRTFNMLLRQERIDEAMAHAKKRKHLINTDVDPMTGRPQNQMAYELSPRKAIIEYEQAMREMNAATRAIMVSRNLTGEEKRERLDELTKTRHELLSGAAEFMDVIDEIEDAPPAQ